MRFISLLVSLTAVGLGAACNGGVETGTGGHTSTSSSAPGTGGGSDAGPDADAGDCPDWLGNKPGEPCSVPEGKECGGNTGVSFTFVRCCGGQWLAPDGGSSESPPCP
ncbi:MAG: hypothetical protein QM820_19345 [Minicystis sp.]